MSPDVGNVTIDVLPDNVLLDIFDFCLDLPQNFFVDRTKRWQRLVHVCQRWRCVVFQSTRRLDLQILCTARKPVREMLDIWPALPLILWVGDGPPAWGMDNIIAALEHRDRISRISIDHTSRLETLLPLMQEPFPALTFLDLDTRSSIPDSFLGGSAPHLRCLYLEAIPFPTLPKLLLSATNLLTLSLRNVPHSGYISPESMAACLFALVKLERLVLRFQSPRSRPNRESRRPPSPTRTILPALARLEFKGVSEYFEDLIARIDETPVLDYLQITLFTQPILHTPQLSQFIGRVPKFQTLDEPRVVISNGDISVTVHPSPTQTLGHRHLRVGIALRDLDWEPSSLAQLCTSSLPLFLAVEHLYMTSPLLLWRDIENAQWLELLRPFTSAKNLYLSKEFALRLAPALQELVGERATEVLPALQNLFLVELRPSGPVQQAIELFVYARQLFGHPIAVSQWIVGENEQWEINV